MKNTSYTAIFVVIIVIAIIGISSYMGISQTSNVHMDNGNPVSKNITVQSKEFNNRQYVITDTENIKYITSEQNELKMSKGRNYTITTSTFNNDSGYWILTSNEIIQPKGGK